MAFQPAETETIPPIDSEIFARANTNERGLFANLQEHPEVLAGVLTLLDGERQAEAQDLIHKWTQQPLEQFRKDKRSVDKSVVQSVHIAHTFAQSLRILDEAGRGDVVSSAIRFWRDTIIRPDTPELILEDFYYYAFAMPDKLLHVKHRHTLLALQIAQTLYDPRPETTSLSMYLRDKEQARRNGRTSEMCKVPIVGDKYRRLDARLDKIQELQKFYADRKLVDETTELEDDLGHIYAVFLVVDKGKEDLLGCVLREVDDPMIRYIVRKQIKIWTQEFEKKGLGVQFADALDQAFRLTIFRKDQVSDGDVPGNMKENLLRQLFETQPLEDRQVEPHELDMIFQELVPSFDPMAMREQWQKDMARAKSGWRALSIRGNAIVFREDEDAVIRDMGLSQIVYVPTREGVDVYIWWGSSWRTELELDYTYKPKSLEHIPEAHHDWILGMVYGYLAEIKGSDIRYEQVVYEREPQKEKVDLSDEDARYAYDVDAYLRVLPRGHRPSLEPEAIEDARFYFGIDLTILNDIVVHMQETGQDMETTLRQFGVKEEEWETYAIHVDNTFGRIALRPDYPEDAGKLYMVTYVRPYTAQNTPSEPRVMHMSDVTRRIFHLPA